MHFTNHAEKQKFYLYAMENQMVPTRMSEIVTHTCREHVLVTEEKRNSIFIFILITQVSTTALFFQKNICFYHQKEKTPIYPSELLKASENDTL